ncbi:MAG: amidohydrolase [Clostridiales bacterium]|nr:amidohydrolase [Clostridia bacterium]MCR4563228.1 amidohydrolase [Clostridiales bacterium]
MIIIDAHTHLWKTQNGVHNSTPVRGLKNGRSLFAGETRQMMPPYMLDGENNVEMLISNMDYACVSGAVITQEVMDGNQDEYLLESKNKYPDRIKICSLYEEGKPFSVDGFDGIKLCACKLNEKDLTKHFEVFKAANDNGKFISVDLADGDEQTGALKEIAEQLPDLKIAIGHFGMVTRENWLEQIKLARMKNVFIESGGITWLFNSEFYPYPTAIKSINEAAYVCGFDKLMFGSDYPRTMVEITYKMSFDFIVKTNEISLADKEKMLGLNAVNFYGFENAKEIEPIKHML